MLTIIAISLIGSWIPFGADGASSPEITILEADEHHAVVQIDLAGYNVNQLSDYSRFEIPEYYWDMDAPIGDPELPLIPLLIGIPSGMEASVTLLNAYWTPAGQGRPYPVQPELMECDEAPRFFAELRTDLQGVYPGNPVNLEAQGNWAGVNVAVLQMNPVSWNAETAEFNVASTMTARIDFHGNRDFQTSVRPEIANMLSSRIVNYDALNIQVDSSPITIDEDVYICVIPNENLESFTPFLAMVNSLGHHVNIIEMDPSSTSYMIKSAISNAYQEGVTRFAVIPARHQQLESKNYGSFYGDFYYSLMSSDNYPDIAVGRFPGNFSQLENQTAKTMSYISYVGETGEPSLPASAVLAAHQEDYPGKYTENSEAVRLYDYALADVVFETVYPPEGGTPDDVSAAINEGVGIVNYRGHGSNTTWQWTGSWNAGAIYALTNTHFPPVFNVCCSNGTHDLTYNCLAESWLDGPGTGSSGTLAASAPSATYANHSMQKELFKQIFDTGNTCAGEMVAASQAYIIQVMGASGLNNSKMYHWFGDPSMDIPTSDVSGAPFELDFSVPSAVNVGSNTLHITVTSGGSPVEGVVVTVTDGIGNHATYPESFYEQQITDSSGEVWLDFTALEGKNLYYGARLHNYASVTGTIDVVTTGIEGFESFATELMPVSPTPVRAMANISFTTPVAGPATISVVDIAGRVVDTLHQGVLQAGSGSMVLDASEMTTGIYFVVMQTPESTITRKMAVVR